VAVPDDDQALVQTGECLDDQVRPLVADQPADVEEVAGALGARREPLGIDGGVDHLGRAAVEALDALRHGGRVGDEDVHPGGGAPIPTPKPGHQEAGRRPDGYREPPAFRLEVPGVAHRRVAVAQVRDSVGDANGLRTRMAARDDGGNVVDRVAHCPRKRHGGQEPLVVTGRSRNLLQEGGFRPAEALG
jgi:hypothetical protein